MGLEKGCQETPAMLPSLLLQVDPVLQSSHNLALEREEFCFVFELKDTIGLGKSVCL